MNLLNIVLVAALGTCIILQVTHIQAEAGVLTGKDDNKKEEDKKEEGEKVEGGGSKRAEAIKAGIDKGVDKVLDSLKQAHPAMKVAVPIAKKLKGPALKKVNSGIDNFFDKKKKKDQKKEDDKKKEEEKKEGEKKEEEKKEEEKKEEEKKEEEKKE